MSTRQNSSIQKLGEAPFHLDDAAVAWVKATYARLTLDEKVAQLFVLFDFGSSSADFERIKRLRPAGSRAFSVTILAASSSASAHFANHAQCCRWSPPILKGVATAFPSGLRSSTLLGSPPSMTSGPPFGYPYLLYDAPRVPTYINAYSTLESVQRAVVDALLGRIPWNRQCLVDPFCGLEDARY